MLSKEIVAFRDVVKPGSLQKLMKFEQIHIEAASGKRLMGEG